MGPNRAQKGPNRAQRGRRASVGPGRAPAAGSSRFRRSQGASPLVPPLDERDGMAPVTLADALQLRAVMAAARQAWLDVELELERLDGVDGKLESDVDMTR